MTISKGKAVAAEIFAASGVIGGYAPLDSGLFVPVSYLPTGTGAAQVALGNHIHATGTMASASYLRTAGNYTTTSTTFVDVDGTNMALTITTGARRCLVGLACSATNTTAGALVFLDVDVDGTRIGNASGVLGVTDVQAGGYHHDGSFVVLTDALSAGSHTFKLKWRVSSGTGTIWGGTTPTTDPAAQFWVMEQLG